MVWYDVRAVRQEVLVLELELIRVVGTRGPLALNVGLLHDLVVLRDSKLLICRIRGGDDDFPAAGVAAHLGLRAPLLAGDAHRLLPPSVVLLAPWVIFVVVRADLSLVRDRVGN